MKQVVLIGDSIRLGYQAAARAALADVAEVWTPAENGGHTVNVLVNLNAWVLTRQPDVLHVNAGLHDLKTLVRGTRDTLVPLPFYRENVGRILHWVRETSPKTRVIWAATTPVHEGRLAAGQNPFLRHEKDVEAYNAAAREVCARFNVPINDLHAFIQERGRDQSLTADGVHFTPDAYVALGKKVAAVVREYL